MNENYFRPALKAKHFQYKKICDFNIALCMPKKKGFKYNVAFLMLILITLLEVILKKIVPLPAKYTLII